MLKVKVEFHADGRATCCLHVGKFVGVISFYCESGGGYSCSLITLILFCLEREGKKNPLWNIHQGKSNLAKKECLGNNFLELKGAI